MRTISFLLQAAVCLLAFFHYQTCSTQTCEFDSRVSIAALESGSSEFDQQCVTVSGKVTDKLSTAVLKIYYLRDMSGQELLVTVPLTETLPSINDELVVGGQLIELYNISEVIKAKVLTETKRATIERNDVELKGISKETREGETSILPY